MDEFSPMDERGNDETLMKVRELSRDELTQPERDVIETMMSSLPDELSAMERAKI